MTISLYDASVATHLQILDAMSGFLARAKAHFIDNDIDPEELVEARLVADMHPFRFQVMQTVFHSAGAVEAIKSGMLRLPGERPQHDYAGLQALVDGARETLRTVTPEEVNARAGAEVVFEVRDTRRLFTAEGYLLSFALPNFYFHATTAYDILRSKGAPLGKLDFMGALKLKT